MSFSQPHPDGICLRYPENLGLQPTITHELAVTMLQRAVQLSQHTPFTWGYIDKPAEGQMFMIFVSPQLPFPPDGIRYQDQEQRYAINAGNGRELEVMEVKFGFVPGVDNAAFRVRRRFRLQKGGHPQLVLIHYSRGQSMSIVPSLNQPVRAYPLRPINEPAVYVMGEKMGQKVFPGGAPGQVPQPPTPLERQQSLPSSAMAAMGMNFAVGMGGNPQALLAQQNSNMEALERRSQRERSGSMGGVSSMPRETTVVRSLPLQQVQRQQQQQQQRIEDDDSADEADFISTRTLALTRYKQNHDLMNEVFMHAAFGDKKKAPPPPPFSIFKQSELDEKVAKLTAEIEELKAKAAAREAARPVGGIATDESQAMSIET